MSRVAVIALAVLAGCVFTSKPMIPDNSDFVGGDSGSTRTSADAAPARDAAVPDVLAPDVRFADPDVPPNTEDAGAAPSDAGPATPGLDAAGGGADDASSTFDAAVVDVGTATDAPMLDAARCDAGPDAAPDAVCVDDAGPDARTAD